MKGYLKLSNINTFTAPELFIYLINKNILYFNLLNLSNKLYTILHYFYITLLIKMYTI